MLELFVLPLQIFVALMAVELVKNSLQKKKWETLEEDWKSHDWDLGL